METIFPTTPGYAGFFLAGVRKEPDHSSAIRRVGAAILKRTYDIEPATGALSPAAEPLPVFMRDQPDNLVINSDFESPLSDWQPAEGVTLVRHPDDPEPDKQTLKVTGQANGRATRTLTLTEPLGGRNFWLSLKARANTPARIEGVQLEADGSPPLGVINADLTTAMTSQQAGGTWPAGLAAAEMRVVLRMATDGRRAVFYDDIQVEERAYRTVWDPATTLRYEHDLAAFKPEGDLIVLGLAGQGGVHRVLVNGVPWLTRILAAPAPPAKALFGWEPRVGGAREKQAGTYPTPDGGLPPDFDNRFYNGYRRPDAGQGITTDNAPFPYLPAGASIEITRDDSVVYRFNLRRDPVAAAYFYYSGSGPDEASNWRRRSVVMNPDTLVVEPEENRCYMVWRGVWPFDNQPEAAYRRLVVEAAN